MDFFVGLTDHEEEGVWKWASSGRTLNCTKDQSRGWTSIPSNCYPYPRGPWGENEPNGKKKEDCVAIKVTKKYYNSESKWNMADVVCSKKSNIVCQKSFHYNELDVNDLPKN